MKVFWDVLDIYISEKKNYSMVSIHIGLAQWLLMKAREFCAVYFLIDSSLPLPARGSAGGPHSNSLLHLLPPPLLFW